MLIGTINRSLRSYIKAIIGVEYVLRWLPRGTHVWRKFVTLAELQRGLRRHGLSIAERCGIAFNPLSVRWVVSSDLSTTCAHTAGSAPIPLLYHPTGLN